jgi:hypothetical protein
MNSRRAAEVTHAASDRANLAMANLRRPFASTAALIALLYVAWAMISTVLVMLVGVTLASVVSRELTLDRPRVTAVIVTGLAAVAGLGAPTAISRVLEVRRRVRLARSAKE